MKLPIYSERIVALSVVYHPYRRNTERFIRAVGAFEVNFQPGDDVLFTRHHHTYPDKDRTSKVRLWGGEADIEHNPRRCTYGKSGEIGQSTSTSVNTGIANGASKTKPTFK